MKDRTKYSKVTDELIGAVKDTRTMPKALSIMEVFHDGEELGVSINPMVFHKVGRIEDLVEMLEHITKFLKESKSEVVEDDDEPIMTLNELLNQATVGVEDDDEPIMTLNELLGVSDDGKE